MICSGNINEFEQQPLYRKSRTPSCANLALAGPAGVGKSTVAQILAPRIAMIALDFDDFRSQYSDLTYFRLRSLSLGRCLPTLLSLALTGCVLDVGGDIVFRPNADNDARLNDMQEFKSAAAAFVAVLTAARDVLSERFLAAKGRSLATPDRPWEDWDWLAASYWAQCADFSPDTSPLDAGHVATPIQFKLKARP